MLYSVDLFDRTTGESVETWTEPTDFGIEGIATRIQNELGGTIEYQKGEALVTTSEWFAYHIRPAA